jgi:hypothetical protein
MSSNTQHLVGIALVALAVVLWVALFRRWSRHGQPTAEQLQRDRDEARYVAQVNWERARAVPLHPLEQSMTPEWLRQATDRFEPSEKSQERRP